MVTGHTFFLNKIIWNTKQRNSTDDKVKIIAHVLYLTTIDPLVCIPVCDTPSVEIFICDRRGYATLDAQPNTPKNFRTPMPVYQYISDPPNENL